MYVYESANGWTYPIRFDDSDALAKLWAHAEAWARLYGAYGRPSEPCGILRIVRR